MRQITHAKLLSLAHYDPETGVFTRLADGYVMGKPDRKGYLLTWLKSWRFRSHRLAWFYMTGNWPAQEIDHINGDTSDNRWANLRECTHQQNNHNQPKRRNNKSGVKGVSLDRSGKWHVQVCLNCQVHHGGSFECLKDAEVAVQRLRARLHGEFANHG
ncbi:HNH endonuclease [Pseudomonas sp.]|uniref:HNH endonuclease n=1 Tax=Pseudomonas sp. TaxID=306 RepID=UPI0032661624